MIVRPDATWDTLERREINGKVVYALKLKEGKNTVTFRAFDDAGNSTERVMTVTYPRSKVIEDIDDSSDTEDTSDTSTDTSENNDNNITKPDTNDDNTKESETKEEDDSTAMDNNLDDLFNKLQDFNNLIENKFNQLDQYNVPNNFNAEELASIISRIHELQLNSTTEDELNELLAILQQYSLQFLPKSEATKPSGTTLQQVSAQQVSAQQVSAQQASASKEATLPATGEVATTLMSLLAIGFLAVGSIVIKRYN